MRLTQIYDPKKRMIFSEVISKSVPNTSPRIDYKRIMISTRNEDGTVGDLIIPTERLFSFGVSENSGDFSGFSLPICLFSREGPTKEESQWVNTFDKIVENCVDHLVENREEIEEYGLERKDLVKIKGGLNPLYWKTERTTDCKGRVSLQKVSGVGPTLYVKLIHSKKADRFVSQFYDAMTDEEINVHSLIGSRAFIKAAIKIESIFIGSKISLQVKLLEAMVELSQPKMQYLLASPRVSLEEDDKSPPKRKLKQE